MAILSAARILATAQASKNVSRFGSRDEARKVASIFRKMERPNYGDVPQEWVDEVEGISPERLVLVFTHGDPIVLGTPALLASAPGQALYAPRLNDATRRMREAEALGMQLALDPDNDGRLSPILDDEECALAAYRALLAEAKEYGPATEWDVVTWDDERETKVCRRYIGTESAMRRNFPDWYERERMRAAGIEGVETFAPVEGQHLPALGELESTGCEDVQVPYRIRRRS